MRLWVRNQETLKDSTIGRGREGGRERERDAVLSAAAECRRQTLETSNKEYLEVILITQTMSYATVFV